MCVLESSEPSMVIPVAGPKITSAIWGPLEEYLIAGNEGGEICQYDLKVKLFVHVVKRLIKSQGLKYIIKDVLR